MKETDEKLKENLVQLYYTARARDYEPPKDSGESKKTWSGHWVNGKCKHTLCNIQYETDTVNLDQSTMM
jgi:hypothetical protein